jgi:hypothetical protein
MDESSLAALEGLRSDALSARNGKRRSEDEHKSLLIAIGLGDPSGVGPLAESTESVDEADALAETDEEEDEEALAGAL